MRQERKAEVRSQKALQGRLGDGLYVVSEEPLHLFKQMVYNIIIFAF